MKFGIVLTPHWSGQTSQAAVYEQMINRMVTAEALGYHAVWTTEHHFANDPDYLPFGWEGARLRAYDLAPDPLTLLTFGAARTSRIRLGTGVLMINYDNPVRLAERAAMLDVMSGGRLELGIGRGQQQPHAGAFGIPANDIDGQVRFRESLEIILRAWAGERFAFRGQFFDFDELEVVPTPVQRPYQGSARTGIPLYTSTQNAQNLGEAAALGLSHVTATGAWGPEGISRYNDRQDTFQAAMRDAGLDPGRHRYPGHLFMFCAPTDAEAEEVAEKALEMFLCHVEAHYQRQRQGGYVIGGGRLVEADAGIDQIRAMAKRSFGTNLIGSPRTICEKLTAFMEQAPSMNYIFGITDGGSPPTAFVDRSMRLFATEVAPKFADAREPAGATTG